MAKGYVESGFGRHYIENDWDQFDWDVYQSYLAQKISIGHKAVIESRKMTKDEKDFREELEERMDAIRNKYKGDN